MPIDELNVTSSDGWPCSQKAKQTWMLTGTSSMATRWHTRAPLEPPQPAKFHKPNDADRSRSMLLGTATTDSRPTPSRMITVSALQERVHKERMKHNHAVKHSPK